MYQLIYRKDKTNITIEAENVTIATNILRKAINAPEGTSIDGQLASISWPDLQNQQGLSEFQG